jgi:DNA-binding SARP family transcriptional activator/ATP/maltotriose-dependent transcriptional regulator MalT
VDFGILGQLQAIADGRALQIAGRMPRTLLGRLLVQRNEIVPVGVLIEDIWERPPRSAHSTLQVHISNLRKQLGVECLMTEAGGYWLNAATGTVDADRFEMSVREAAVAGSDARTVERKLSTALRLWRGPALQEFVHLHWAALEAARLEGLREVALENLVDARLARGDHALLIPELEALVAEYPYREHMWAQLMLALHRSHRQTDALRTYARLRSILHQELGVEPSRELSTLERAILSHDRELEWKPSIGAVSTSVRIYETEERPTSHQPASAKVSAADSRFNVPVLARARLVNAMASRFDRRVTLLVAPAGYGKSTLVRQAIDDNILSPRGEDFWMPIATEHRSASVLVAALADRLGFVFEAGVDFDAARGIETIVGAVWSHAPRQVTLILDDLHLLAPDDASMAIIDGLVRALPSNGHLVLTSRHEVSVPLSRLLLLGEAVKIGEQELRFDESELDELCRGRDVAREILALSGGWPALAVLLSAAAYNGPPERVGLDFVWEEVLSSVDPQRRSDLGCLAVVAGVHPIDGEIACAAIGRAVDLEATLGLLPLVTMVDGRYSLHALWRRAFPTDRFDRSVRLAAGQRVADLLRSRKEFETAVALYQELENWPAVLSVVLETCAVGRPAVAIDVLEQWRRAVPSAWTDAPEVALLDAVIVAAHDRREASAVFALAANRFRESEDFDGELVCLTQRGVVAMWLGDLSAGMDVYQRVKELLSVGAITNDDFVRIADVFMAHTVGDWERVLESTEPALHREVITDIDVGAYGFRSLALTGLGEHEEAEALAVRVVDIASPAVRALCLQALVLARWMLREPAESVPDALRLVRVSDEIGMMDHRVANRAIAAVLSARCLQHDDASRHVAEAEQILANQSAGVLAELRVMLARAEVALSCGDEATAAELFKQAIFANPIGSPSTAECYIDSLSNIYVLVPETRRAWGDADLRGRWRDCIAVARALVALREENNLGPVAGLRPEVILGVRPHLSMGFWLELCVAGTAAGVIQLEQFSNEVAGLGRETVRRISATAIPAIRHVADALLASIPQQPSHTVTLQVLGPIQVTRGGTSPRPDRLPTRVCLLLLYLLANTSATESSIIADLWPDDDPALAALSLLETLNGLEQLLDPEHHPGEASYFLRHDDGHLRLAHNNLLDVDLWRYDQLLAAARAHEQALEPAAALNAYLTALELYRAPYLLDVRDKEWAAEAHVRSIVDFVGACARAGELLLAAGRATEALLLARRAIGADRASERAWRLEAAALLAVGDRPAALASLAQCRSVLAELGVEAEPESEMLEQAIRRSSTEKGHPEAS